MKASDFISNIGKTAKSTAKIVLKSRSTRLQPSRTNETLIILANGPSLNQTLSENASVLKTFDTLSVNFAPLSDAFFDVKPKYHVLADPLFFAADKPFNVKDLYKKLAEVDWPLTLLIPNSFSKQLPSEVTGNPNIKLETFNFVGLEGFDWFTSLAYNGKLGMPRPRNVLIPALMCGIWLGYKEIYIAGADHSWMKTISVDENNNVVSVQPHFYKDDKKEQARVDETYRNYRLHDIVNSFAIAFRSYHSLQRYAQKKGVKIVNSTPGSFIDAFPRGDLPRSKK